MGMSVYEVITERILAHLEQGTVPWRQAWAGGSMPKNLISKKDYRGVNVFLLSASGFKSPWWLTARQCNNMGGKIRKGEKSTPVIYWNFKERDDGSKSAFLRYYPVFNSSQCEGIEVPVVESNTIINDPIDACEDIVSTYLQKPAIEYGGTRACYIPSLDRIHMPELTSFNTSEEFYSTLFHEMIHSTGHKDRLGRKGIADVVNFGSHDYSLEELVAECGAAFLCGKSGIENMTLENSAAYIASWSKKLRSNPRWLVEASSQAAKAADYILGVKPTKYNANDDDE